MLFRSELNAILGDVEIVGVYKYRDLLVELMDEAAVKNCKPDFSLMKKHIDKMIITAPGTFRSDASSDRKVPGRNLTPIGSLLSGGASDRNDPIDFVSRFFAPGAGIDEDPVTGSAHSQLIPFWSEKLNKKKMHALQLSQRAGEIWCEQVSKERVRMCGQCVFYMKGEITLAP